MNLAAWRALREISIRLNANVRVSFVRQPAYKRNSGLGLRDAKGSNADGQAITSCERYSTDEHLELDSLVHLGFLAAHLMSLATEPSYFKVSEGDIVFMAWQHGRYFFSVDSQGSGEALDRFIRVFPY
jgi:hypothetical protein